MITAARNISSQGNVTKDKRPWGQPLRKSRSIGMKVEFEALHAKFESLAPSWTRGSAVCGPKLRWRALDAVEPQHCDSLRCV
jgi:hypothetical protein